MSAPLTRYLLAQLRVCELEAESRLVNIRQLGAAIRHGLIAEVDAVEHAEHLGVLPDDAADEGLREAAISWRAERDRREPLPSRLRRAA